MVRHGFRMPPHCRRLAHSALCRACQGRMAPREPARCRRCFLPHACHAKNLRECFACVGALPPAFTIIYIGCRMSTTGERFERAVSIMERLRAPGGCPWDREQTFDSIKPYTLEETYEVLEAIDNRDWEELPGELGDLLLQVLFYSEMAKEQGSFSIDDVLDRLSRKLVDRHPHVFGDVKADTSADVKRNWEALKAEERRKRTESVTEKDEGKALSGREENPASILAHILSSM